MTAATGTVDLTQLVSELADRSKPRSEADVQSGVRTLLLYGNLSLEDPEVRLETPAPGRRRIDVETGRAVIECKKAMSSTHVARCGTRLLMYLPHWPCRCQVHGLFMQAPGALWNNSIRPPGSNFCPCRLMSSGL